MRLKFELKKRGTQPVITRNNYYALAVCRTLRSVTSFNPVFTFKYQPYVRLKWSDA